MTESTTDAGAAGRDPAWSEADQAFLKKLSKMVETEMYARAADNQGEGKVLIAVSAVLADTICSTAVAATGNPRTVHARAELLSRAVGHEIRNRIAQDLEALSRLPDRGPFQ